MQIQPTRIHSTASVAKDTLDRLGIRPLRARQPDFDDRVMGYAMASLYGGRTESHIRRTRVPVSYVDFTSLYPSVSILLGLQDFLTSRRVDVVEADPSELERWLGSVDLTMVLRPELWGQMRGLALVEPHGDILPVRADWHANGTLGIGVNRVTAAAEPLWYALGLVALRVRDRIGVVAGRPAGAGGRVPGALPPIVRAGPGGRFGAPPS